MSKTSFFDVLHEIKKSFTRRFQSKNDVYFSENVVYIYIKCQANEPMSVGRQFFPMEFGFDRTAGSQCCPPAQSQSQNDSI
jgi:hypothetical protein